MHQFQSRVIYANFTSGLDSACMPEYFYIKSLLWLLNLNLQMLDVVLEIRTFILIDKKTSAELDKHKFCSQNIKRSFLF